MKQAEHPAVRAIKDSIVTLEEADLLRKGCPTIKVARRRVMLRRLLIALGVLASVPLSVVAAIFACWLWEIELSPMSREALWVLGFGPIPAVLLCERLSKHPRHWLRWLGFIVVSPYLLATTVGLLAAVGFLILGLCALVTRVPW